MAEPKDVTVIITVDLKCCYTAAKIKYTVCQLEMCFKINSIVFDEKKNTVTVSGHFDPYCFICQLRCTAGEVIKDVVIKPDPPPVCAPVCAPCPAFPCSPMWRCRCYQLCSSFGNNFPCCPPQPQPQPQPRPSCTVSYPYCYCKIVCEYAPYYGCSSNK